MNRRWKYWIAGWIPPHLRRVLDRARPDGAVRYSGNYETWEDAGRRSLGYDAPAIVEKVKRALQQVERGEAACERDSVLFDRVEYSYPLLAALSQAALANSGRMNVIDIGGSLGSTYFQCRDVLGDAVILRWNVVEQRAFVNCGRENFQNESLRFFEDLRTCLASGPADVAVLSGVLPYVESPHTLLDAIVEASIPRVIIDRTPLWTRPDQLTVQSVPPSIYGFPASYPAWILNRERLLNHFSPRYRLIFEFDALAGTIDVDGSPALDTGFFFARSSTAA